MTYTNKDYAQALFNKLTQMGIQKNTAIAITCNAQQESGCNPSALNSIGAVGIVQWYGGSFAQAVMNHATTSLDDLYWQAEYIQTSSLAGQWLQASFTESWGEYIKGNGTINYLIEVFMANFERPETYGTPAYYADLSRRTSKYAELAQMGVDFSGGGTILNPDTDTDGNKKPEPDTQQPCGSINTGDNNQTNDNSNTTSPQPPPTGVRIPTLDSVLNHHVGNGQCYGLSSYWLTIESSGTYGIGAGFISSVPIIGDTIFAVNIGSGYNWSSIGYIVINNPSVNQMQQGDIFTVNGGSWIYDGSVGHTGVIAGLDGNGGYYTYEQNVPPGNEVVTYHHHTNNTDYHINAIIRKG